MIPPEQLRITVLTPAIVGTAGADPLGADREVRVDDLGLPFVPRARMSARLRDAALAVGQAFPDRLGDLLDLFGTSGSTERSRMLAVGRAELPALLRAAVAAADPDLGGPSRAAITAATTVTRTTTAVDADGAPRDGTLRTVRAIAPGLELHAGLHWLRPPGDAHLQALALCCLAFDQIGGDESRGPGRIRCRLDPDTTVELARRTGAA